MITLLPSISQQCIPRVQVIRRIRQHRRPSESCRIIRQFARWRYQWQIAVETTYRESITSNFVPALLD